MTQSVGWLVRIYQPEQIVANTTSPPPLLCKQRKRCARFILLKIQNDIRHIVCIFNILHADHNCATTTSLHPRQTAVTGPKADALKQFALG